MSLQDIISSLPASYDKSYEASLIREVKFIDVSSLTSDLADLLAFSISDGYNDLAKTILEKDYKGKKLDIQSINNSIINQSDQRYSILHFASQFGNKEIILYFLDHSVPISLDKDLLSPLHTLTFAKNLNKKDIIEIITNFKKNIPDIINQKDAFGLTALHYAAHNDNIEALKALMECGAMG